MSTAPVILQRRSRWSEYVLPPLVPQHRPRGAGSVNVVSVGIDAVEVERFRAVIGRRPTIVERLFTDAERGYAARFPDPAERLAARFAVKEATMKALGVGLGAFRFRDVSVGRYRGGAPYLVLSGAAGELALDRGIGSWLVSLTHTALMAEAIVLGLCVEAAGVGGDASDPVVSALGPYSPGSLDVGA